MAIKMKKLGNKKGIKQSLSSGGSQYAQRVPEEGIEIRFMTEPEEWFLGYIHYGDKTSYPCSEEDCMGCEEGLDPKKKWYANAYWPDEDRVVVFEMGPTIAEPILKRYERNNTVMDRNFEITKEGAGMSTRYFVDPLDPSRIKGLDDKELIELIPFMESWLKRAMAEESDEEEISAAGRRHTKTSTKRRRPVEEEDEIEDDNEGLDDEDVEETPRRTARKRPMKKRARR